MYIYALFTTDKAVKAGNNPELVMLEDVGHFEIMAPISPKWAFTLDVFKSFLQQT